MFAKSSVSRQEGKFGDDFSVYFNDSTETIMEIDTNDAFNPGTNDFSICLWVKAPTWNGQYWIGKFDDTDDRWYINTSGTTWKFFSKAGGSTAINCSSTGPNDWFTDSISSVTQSDHKNQWVFAVFSADRDGNGIWYLNSFGQLSRTSSDISGSASANITGSADLNIGHYEQDDAFEANGSIAEITIYTKALSEREVNALYNDRKAYDHKNGIASSSLTNWWRMGDGSEQVATTRGTTVYDMSSSTDNGTIVNSATYSTDSPFT